MTSKPFEPLMRQRQVDDAGAPRAIDAAEVGSMTPEPLRPLMRWRRGGHRSPSTIDAVEAGSMASEPLGSFMWRRLGR
jgi:hypothetical protein